MNLERESGILLHPTCLPGDYGVGEMGPDARRWIDALSAMGQRLWQILPHGPTGYGDSPYQAASTFAGNPLWISLEELVADGLLDPARLTSFPDLPRSTVDFGPVIEARHALYATVCRTFGRRASPEMKAAWEQYCASQSHWLDDFALYVAIKAAHQMQPWTVWPPPLALRQPTALREAARRYRTTIRNVKILQFLFDRQWSRLRTYAHHRSVRVIGDIPIFVAHDSADVWAHPDLFFLDGKGHPLVIAGVPPDYFSATGQRWGNPLYRWDIHQHAGYRWWIQRLARIFEVVDVVRIDHFRGFEAYWEVPAHETTALNGRWVAGPGEDLFDALINALGPLPIIAEDLGVITAAVDALRDKYHFPGMRILQFAFSRADGTTRFRPDDIPANCVVYTGTHDNDTTCGWCWGRAGTSSTRTQAEIEAERRAVLDYVRTDGREIHWDLIAVAANSPANTAIYPLQDVLGLDSSARMNVPGRGRGNWRWRFQWDQFEPACSERLADITQWSKRDQ